MTASAGPRRRRLVFSLGSYIALILATGLTALSVWLFAAVYLPLRPLVAGPDLPPGVPAAAIRASAGLAAAAFLNTAAGIVSVGLAAGPARFAWLAETAVVATWSVVTAAVAGRARSTGSALPADYGVLVGKLLVVSALFAVGYGLILAFVATAHLFGEMPPTILTDHFWKQEAIRAVKEEAAAAVYSRKKGDVERQDHPRAGAAPERPRRETDSGPSRYFAATFGL